MNDATRDNHFFHTLLSESSLPELSLVLVRQVDIAYSARMLIVWAFVAVLNSARIYACTKTSLAVSNAGSSSCYLVEQRIVSIVDS